MEKEMAFTVSEMKRFGVIHALMEKKMTTAEAATCPGLSTRQTPAHKEKPHAPYTPPALRHGNKGRPPVHAFPHELRCHVRKLAKRRSFVFNFSHLDVRGTCLSIVKM